MFALTTMYKDIHVMILFAPQLGGLIDGFIKDNLLTFAFLDFRNPESGWAAVMSNSAVVLVRRFRLDLLARLLQSNLFWL